MLQLAKSPGPVWMPQLELSLGICLGEGLGSIPFWQLYSTKLGIDPDLLFNAIFKDIWGHGNDHRQNSPKNSTSQGTTPH